MRIIAGELKGLTLKMPKGIRPTSDKVREALFDILGQSVMGADILDLFAGSGALGIEAWSRGSGKVIFVDNNPKCIKVIGENIAKLQISNQQLQIYCLDVFKAIKLFGQRSEKFDLILLDPPYYKDLAKKSLISIEQSDILARNALAVAEHYKKDKLEEEIGQLKLFKIKNYGDTTLSFYKNKPCIRTVQGRE